MTPRTATAQLLRQAIKRTGLSENEVARRSGIDRGNLSRILNGRRGVTLVTLYRVMQACGLEIHLLKVR